jgi:hypothetical protein
MLSGADAVRQANRLKGYHEAERGHLDTVRAYWKGRQDLPAVIPSSAPREVRKMAKMARVNVCDVVVDALAQSLFVEGFRVGNDADNIDGVWGVWQANRMDRRQSGIHRAAAAYGTSYMVVLPGDPVPVMRGVSPRRLTALYGEDPDWPVWALERTGQDTFRLYDEEAVYFLGRNPRAAPGEAGLMFLEAREHGLDVCPVVRFRDAEDLDEDDEPNADGVTLGQIAPLMHLQDQIDLTTFGLLVAQHYSAFRQRYILGWVADDEATKMQAAASQLWTFEDHPDEVKLGEFSETNLKGYIDSREASIRHAASLSQTPVHELTGSLVNISQETLAAVEAGRDRKVAERKTGLGESHEQAFQVVGRLLGRPVPDDGQVVWRDTSARAFAATVDGLGKLVALLGIPPQELWERVPGATQQDVERWKAQPASGDSMAFLADMLDQQAAGLDPVA